MQTLLQDIHFSLRIRIANHRAQLNVGDGAVLLTKQSVSELPDTTDADEPGSLRQGRPGYSVMVRVSDVDRHHERASQGGARIQRPPHTKRLFVLCLSLVYRVSACFA